uniref:Uncharacterized protein n=1 Tax=Rhizophora mucronata TaxID=61149 RepID=A0A2P2NYB6_RHIMU
MNCPCCLSKLSSLDRTAALHSNFEVSENFEIVYQVADVHFAQLKQNFSSGSK